ncbi:hypothetical protein FA13DRAFT_1719036 [Coprinellus micaceus]|uniref:Uncharacterized protein n=1 Tax=Coprinellus micaceus TaxID=71717 RepID=A0A4Y7SD28_COPMI|nr:hypothetical protein FA13DRAFT_1719036 [Coprinellus micaceus]
MSGNVYYGNVVYNSRNDNGRSTCIINGKGCCIVNGNVNGNQFNLFPANFHDQSNPDNLWDEDGYDDSEYQGQAFVGKKDGWALTVQLVSLCPCTQRNTVEDTTMREIDSLLLLADRAPHPMDGGPLIGQALQTRCARIAA